LKVFLDTHAAVFLAAGRAREFGPASRDLLERAAIFVSPAVRFELAMLVEAGKIKTDPDSILGALAADLGARLSSDPFAAVVAAALPLSFTRDPFDRLIVATAILHRAPLVTRDERLRRHFAGAVW
jgi:PIN domain nuclease of toxin-antitoxin system